MNSEVVFHLSVSVAVWVIMGTFLAIGLKVMKLMKQAEENMRMVTSAGRQIGRIPQTVKIAGWTLFNRIVGRMMKGGEEDGKK